MQYCGFPENFIGLPVYPLIMIILLSISLYFVYFGGQIAVIIADFFQGIFAIIVLLVVVLYLFFTVSWDQVADALEQTPIKLAREEISDLETQETFKSLTAIEKENQIKQIEIKYENSSRINPFKTSHVEDFNFWYFLIGIIGIMYGTLGWQGQQGYNSSAKSAHEAKMGAVLGGFRGLSQGLFFLVVPVLIYVFMNHADYQSVQESVNLSLTNLNSETLMSQMRGPIVLSKVLPVGLLGLFASLMLVAFVSTHDTYLHSWATILVQDVIMPFRKEPFDKNTHLKVLRYAIFGVAIFIFLFSLLFQQNQKIALFFAITAAIFAGGSGAVIIGGLYWKRGTTTAAWSAMIVGALISVGGVLVKQISIDWLSDMTSLSQLKSFFLYIRDINGQEYWGIGMALSSITYITISLLTNKKPYNMDKLLNRGEFAIKGEKTIVNENEQIGWKIFLMGDEFTKGDKFLYILNYIWTGVWTLVFIIGTIYNLSNNVSNQTWMLYWRYYIYVHVMMSLITMVWFSIGGFRDLKVMMKRLRNDVRDHGDDGWVSKKNN